jgi:hypothetical protein
LRIPVFDFLIYGVSSCVLEEASREGAPIPRAYFQAYCERLLSACDRAMPTKTIADLFNVSTA